jgi:hypothetical protein
MSQVWSFDQRREGDWCLLSLKADTGLALVGSPSMHERGKSNLHSNVNGSLHSFGAGKREWFHDPSSLQLLRGGNKHALCVLRYMVEQASHLQG